jgi:hypothetical protein
MFFDGDLLSGRWSIGYHSDKTQSLSVVGDLLGNETGICAYGHLKTEADSSITRGDWLAPEMNSNYASYPEFAQELLDLAKSMTGGNLTPQVLAQHQYNRKKYSIANNPNYFSPAYAGVAFTFGAHMFAYHLLANHWAEYPRGFLTPEVFQSFFSYTKDANNNLVSHMDMNVSQITGIIERMMNHGPSSTSVFPPLNSAPLTHPIAPLAVTLEQWTHSLASILGTLLEDSSIQ